MRSLLCAFLLLGLISCGKKDESIAKRAGKTLGETATDFVSGVGKGVDVKSAVTVELSSDLARAGLSRTVAKSLGLDVSGKGISVYLISKKKFEGTLVARALDGQGQEIGRSKAKVRFGEDDAKYITFTFDSQMDRAMVAKYVLDRTR